MRSRRRTSARCTSSAARSPAAGASRARRRSSAARRPASPARASIVRARIARELGRVLLREVVGALPVGGRRRGRPVAVEQRRARDRELGGARVQAILAGRRRSVASPTSELIAVSSSAAACSRSNARLGDLGEHRVGLGGGLAAGERRAAQRGARVVGAAERDQRARERELVARRDVAAASPRPRSRSYSSAGVGVIAARARPRRASPAIASACSGSSSSARRHAASASPRVLAVGEQLAERRVRARRGAVIAARLGEPRDLAPRRRPRPRGSLAARIVAAISWTAGSSGASARAASSSVCALAGSLSWCDEHVGEPQPQLHRARGSALPRRARATGARARASAARRRADRRARRRPRSTPGSCSSASS